MRNDWVAGQVPGDGPARKKRKKVAMGFVAFFFASESSPARKSLNLLAASVSLLQYSPSAPASLSRFAAADTWLASRQDPISLSTIAAGVAGDLIGDWSVFFLFFFLLSNRIAFQPIRATPGAGAAEIASGRCHLATILCAAGNGPGFFFLFFLFFRRRGQARGPTHFSFFFQHGFQPLCSLRFSFFTGPDSRRYASHPSTFIVRAVAVSVGYTLYGKAFAVAKKPPSTKTGPVRRTAWLVGNPSPFPCGTSWTVSCIANRLIGGDPPEPDRADATTPVLRPKTPGLSSLKQPTKQPTPLSKPSKNKTNKHSKPKKNKKDNQTQPTEE